MKIGAENSEKAYVHYLDVVTAVEDAPAVDTVELPEGKPGDYLEWYNGVGQRQIYAILSVMICKDCIRYELADFAPVVNHKGIVRILSPEEVDKMVKERGKAWKYMWCKDDNKTASGTEG
jgi:hypothetical protein